MLLPHKPFTSEQALEEIKRATGTQFDPELSKIFVDLFSKTNRAQHCVKFLFDHRHSQQERDGDLVYL
jgi:HD-GYP domain